MRRQALASVAIGSLGIACVESTESSDTGTTTTSSGSSDVESGSSTSGVAADESTSSIGGTTDSGGSSEGGSTGTESSTGEPTCPDVGGMYYVGYDYGLFPICHDALTTTNACGVTQEGCQLYWACNGAFENYLPPGPIDADGVYFGAGRFDGGPFQCMITFMPDHLFAWECLASDGTVCTGGGF